jgi:hypothetical protein
MGFRKWFCRLVLAAVAVVAVFAVVVGYEFLTRDRQASSLYVTAVENRSADSGGGQMPVEVNVWIDGALLFRRVSGGRIPIISLKPGYHTLKVTAPGYMPYVKRIDVSPPHSDEIYVLAKLTRASRGS